MTKFPNIPVNSQNVYRMTSCKDIHSTDLLKEEWEWTNKLGSSQKSKLRVLGLGVGQFGQKEVTDSKGYVDNRTEGFRQD